MSKTINHLITDHIDTWTSAVKKKSATGRGSSKKIELYGIKKLHELILELAVRGKLVPQDPNDEPASVLLEHIAEKKAQLVREKKVKKPRKFNTISKDEKVYELPIGWEWSRIEDIGYDLGQLKPVSDFTYIDVGSINKELGFVNDPNVLSESSAPSRARKLVKKGTVIYSTIRPYLLNIAVIDKEFNPKPIASTAFAIIHPLEGVLASYIYRYLRSPSFISYVERVQTGVAYPAVNEKQFFFGVIPLAPTKEQHRIVAKVDELMLLCDQLEQQTESSIEAHKTLVEVLLNTLTDSKDTAELQTNWARVSEFFDTLFTTEHSIDQLKQTILQLAVMGKLVPQDPSDEPASKLLERIAAEKAQLIADKKIKKQKPLPEITDEEKPFELPNGWEWCRVWDVAEIITSGSREWAKYYSESGAIFVTMANLARGDYKLRLNTLRYVTPPVGGEGARTSLVENDLLISITGDVGNLGLIPADFGEAYINQHTCLLRFMPQCYSKYFPELMRSPWAKFQFDAPQRGIKNSFRLGDVGEMHIPLPPKGEQLRIAEQVDELMNVCEKLKLSLLKSQQIQLQFTDSLVNNSL